MREGAAARARLVGSALVLSTLLALAWPGTAHALDDGSAGWVTFSLRAPFGDRLALRGRVEPRLFEDRLQVVLLRPWLDVALPFGFSVGAGYDAVLFVSPRNREEHRAWQQVGHRHDFGTWRTMLRFRLEERFFSDVDDVSVRGRLLFGVAVPLSRGIEAEISNEIFTNFNDVPVLGVQGFVENRFYAGLSQRFEPWLWGWLGYQMLWLDGTPEDRIHHTVMLGVFVELPNALGTEESAE